MKTKLALLSLSGLLLAACGNSSENNPVTSNYNPESYDQTMRFITENFELEYEPKDTNVPDYLSSYDVRNISDNITMGLNASGQVSYLSFDRLTRDELDIILENLEIDEDQDVELLLDNEEEFREKHDQNYLVHNISKFDVNAHILNVNNITPKGYRENEPYDINLFYNEDLFNEFMKN